MSNPNSGGYTLKDEGDDLFSDARPVELWPRGGGEGGDANNKQTTLKGRRQENGRPTMMVIATEFSSAECLIDSWMDLKPVQVSLMRIVTIIISNVPNE